MVILKPELSSLGEISIAPAAQAFLHIPQPTQRSGSTTHWPRSLAGVGESGVGSASVLGPSRRLRNRTLRKLAILAFLRFLVWVFFQELTNAVTNCAFATTSFWLFHLLFQIIYGFPPEVAEAPVSGSIPNLRIHISLAFRTPSRIAWGLGGQPGTFTSMGIYFEIGPSIE